jgi:hypothetical protein
VKSSECGSKKKTAGKQAECECVWLMVNTLVLKVNIKT